MEVPMDENTTADEISQDRRQFVGAAAIAVAATQLGAIGSTEAQSGKGKPGNLPKIKRGTHTLPSAR
jgi:nitrous oxide reductase